jgi:hypothetical protein
MKLSCIAFDEESGVLTLEIDEEAKQFLLERGVNSLLMETLEKLNEQEVSL